MVGSFSEDALKKFRDAMFETQPTNMPSRGMPSTFGEEKIAFKRDEITGELKTADQAAKIPPAPAKGKKRKALPKGTTQPGVSQSSKAAQLNAAALSLNKQANQAGRDAQMKNIQRINSQRVNPG